MRLGIDLDGVVAQFNKGWMERHAREFGSSLDPSMMQEWDILHVLGDFASQDAFWDWFRNGDEPSTFRHLEPYPHAMETIHRLAEAGHKIVIISHKFDWAIPDTLAWLGQVGMPTREVHLTEHKYEVSCDVYLDDSPYVLPTYVEHHPDALTCRFVRAWNNPVPGAVDVHDWEGFERVVIQRSSQ
ncbi:MAG: hypothetical protein AAGA59_00160 [Actinomycetota bacterium]